MNEQLQPVHTGEIAQEWRGFQSGQLISLHMILFLAGYLQHYVVSLDYLLMRLITRQEAEGEAAPVKSEEVASAQHIIVSVRPILEMVEMNRSLERLETFNGSEHWVEAGYGLHHLVAQLEELRSAIRKDLNDKKFLYMPPTQALYYKQSDPFGVGGRFPKANEEFIIAGNCYATENYTACVFHLMRGVELAVRVLVKALRAEKFLTKPVYVRGKKVNRRVPIELCEWDFLLKGMTSALTKLENGKRTSLEKQKTHLFYTEAIGTFRHFKDAWRNIVCHMHEIGDTGRTVYLPTECSDIWEKTKGFMGHLGTRLSE